MADAIRYFFDEHLPTSAANGLLARGIDVVRVPDLGRIGFPDDDQLRFSTQNGWVFVTYDADFLVLATEFLTTGESFTGIAFAPRGKYQTNVGGLVRALIRLSSTRSASDMVDTVEYL